jgi:hypothetical protein
MKATVGAGAGAALLMYFLDPHSGRKRRAESRQRAGHLSRRFARWSEAASRDVRNRARGMVAMTLAKARPMKAAPDDVLAARVKTQIGRLSRHPHALQVVSCEGIVELRGPILMSERRHVIEGVRRVRGVVRVEDRMFGHESAKSVPALQGGPDRAPDRRPEFLQENWSPAARLVAGTAGAGLLGYGVARRGLAGAGAAMAGSLVLARTVANVPMRRLLALSEKSIDLAPPPEASPQPG